MTPSSRGINSRFQLEPSIGPQQHAAIELLVQGKGKSTVAEAVTVTPYTVSRWHRDALFVATLNSRRVEIQQGNAARLRSLAGKAIDVVEQGLESGDSSTQFKAAALVLKSTGLDEMEAPRGPSTEDDVETEWASKRRMVKLNQMLAAAF